MGNEEIEIQEPAADEAATPERDNVWVASCGLVAAIAAFLRFFWLDLKPLHHDEGVNGYFLTTLFRKGEYHYDPANYHGPDLYYLSLTFSKIFGLNTWSVRTSVALFGVLTVLLVFALKRYIGKTGTLFAALFLALSPGMVFISRYFIHEILFVFFSLAIVVSMVYFLDRRKAGVFAIASMVLLLIICFLPSTLNIASMIGKSAPSLLWPARILFAVVELALVGFVTRMLMAWNDGQPIYLLLASASMMLLFATKETAFITIGTMVIAVCCVWGWQKIAGGEMFANSKFGIFTGATAVVTLAALALSGQIKEGVSKLYDEFIPLNQSTQTAVFYGIVILALTAIAAWVMYLVEIRRGENSSELDEPDALTLGRLEERLQASSFLEIVIVKSGILAITVFVIWAFVRIGVAMIMTYGERGDAMIGWRKLDFENFDFVILAFGAFLAAVAAIAYFVKRPAKLSADLILMIAASIVMFFYLGALFFSSFFTYPEGLQGAFKAYAIWTKTGSTDHTQNGFLAYVKWGMKLESPIMILSALGLLIALVRTRHRFALFTGLWAFGLFAAYTIIPYKTPWLALSFLLPMAISAGYALNEMLGSKFAPIRIAGMIAAVLGSSILAYQTYDLNFVRYDNDAMPYVYAHTKRGFAELIEQVNRYSERSGKGKEATIEIVSPDYWPMPWYLNDYEHANFHGKIVDVNTSEMIIAKMVDQEPDVLEKYATRYKFVGTYPLRPGVDLMLLVRNDLADPEAQDLYSVFGAPATPEDEEEEPPAINKPN